MITQKKWQPLAILVALLALGALSLALPHPALAAQVKAQQARDVVQECKFSVTVNKDTSFQLRNQALHKIWNGGEKGMFTVTLPGDQKAQGVMLAFNTYVPQLIVESMDGEKPEVIAEYSLPYYTSYIPFSKPAHVFRVRPGKENAVAIRIGRMNVLTEGALPAWVQRWETLPDGQADILLMVTHPDDDILWFGGLLPTYAGEKDLKVLVGYISTENRWDRRNELLDALWHCGVKYYPYMPEGKVREKKEVDYIVTCIRRYRPPVVVTQDIDGEYGHKAHIKLVANVIKAVKTECLKETVARKSAKKYGVYQPQKLYVHMYKENQSIFDWSVPLKAFNGKTGLTIAKEAFKMHASQQNGRHAVLDHGKYDCRKLGLYWSRVGKDNIKRPDLMQHVINE